MKQIHSYKFKRKLNSCQPLAGQSVQPAKGRQLDFFPLINNPQKPQIASIPGVSPKEPKRYRIVLGGQILADRLTADEALKALGGGI